MSDMKIAVNAGPHDRRFSPVCLTVPVPDGACSAVIQPSGLGEKEIPPPPIVGQIGEVADGKAELTFVLPYQKKNSTVEYDVEFKTDAVPAGVDLDTQDNGDVEITIQGQRLGRYYVDADEYFRPFIHPIMGPYGHSVTRGYPVEPRANEAEDHPHHKSVWVAHGDMNGVDNWHVGGRQYQREVLACSGGAVKGVLQTKNDWTDLEGNKTNEDIRKWTFWSMPGGLRVFDLDIQIIASEGELKLGDTKEGGILSVRVATTMDVPRTGKIEIAEGGVDEDETWGKRSAWCDYSGLDEGGNRVGIAVMNDPNSFRYPTYWHVRNYGLMGANPFGLSHFYGDKDRDGTVVLQKGESLWFGYRVFVHGGDADGGQVEDAFHSYVNPPVASVVE